jgi:hypothetical protein
VVDTPEKAWRMARRLARSSRLTQQELFDALTEHMQLSTLPFDERPTVREVDVNVDDSWSWPAAFDAVG